MLSLCLIGPYSTDPNAQLALDLAKCPVLNYGLGSAAVPLLVKHRCAVRGQELLGVTLVTFFPQWASQFCVAGPLVMGNIGSALPT